MVHQAQGEKLDVRLLALAAGKFPPGGEEIINRDDMFKFMEQLPLHQTKIKLITPPPVRQTVSVLERLVGAYKLWQQYWPHLTRATKYTLAEKIDAAFVETLELFFTASHLDRQQKLPYLQKAVAKFDALKFLLRVLWEIKSLDDKKYIALSEHLTEVGKMLGGWYKQVIRQTQTPSR